MLKCVLALDPGRNADSPLLDRWVRDSALLASPYEDREVVLDRLLRMPSPCSDLWVPGPHLEVLPPPPLATTHGGRHPSGSETEDTNLCNQLACDMRPRPRGSYSLQSMPNSESPGWSIREPRSEEKSSLVRKPSPHLSNLVHASMIAAFLCRNRRCCSWHSSSERGTQEAFEEERCDNWDDPVVGRLFCADGQLLVLPIWRDVFSTSNATMSWFLFCWLLFLHARHPVRP